MSKNVAVFVDVANIFYAAKAAGVDIDYVTLLKSATAGRDFVRAYAYTGLDPDNENQRNFHQFLARHQYKVVSKDIRKYGDGKVKANLDIELVVDLMKTARNLDIAVIVSGDGDFASAIRAVQEMGVRVEVVSFRGNTSSDLIEVADLFTDITQIAKVDKGSTRSGRRVAEDDDEDLSMTEVPEKMTEGTGRGRGRGRGRGGRYERDEAPVAARAPRGRVPDAPMGRRSPHRRRRARRAPGREAVACRRRCRQPRAPRPATSRSSTTRPRSRPTARPSMAMAAGAAGAAVAAVVAAGVATRSARSRASSRTWTRTRRRTRSSRGRGRCGRRTGRRRDDRRGRGRATRTSEAVAEAPAPARGRGSRGGRTSSGEYATPFDDLDALAAPRAPRSTPFGSVWDTQLGAPARPAASGPAPVSDEDEDLDEPEIPEYLLAERRQANRGGGGGGNRGRGGSGAPGRLRRGDRARALRRGPWQQRWLGHQPLRRDPWRPEPGPGSPAVAVAAVAIAAARVAAAGAATTVRPSATTARRGRRPRRAAPSRGARCRRSSRSSSARRWRSPGRRLPPRPGAPRRHRPRRRRRRAGHRRGAARPPRADTAPEAVADVAEAPAEAAPKRRTTRSKAPAAAASEATEAVASDATEAPAPKRRTTRAKARPHPRQRPPRPWRATRPRLRPRSAARRAPRHRPRRRPRPSRPRPRPKRRTTRKAAPAADATPTEG